MTTLVTAREYESYDEKIRAQAEMLTSLLSAGLQTQDAADKAVLALSFSKRCIGRSQAREMTYRPSRMQLLPRQQNCWPRNSTEPM